MQKATALLIIVVLLGCLHSCKKSEQKKLQKVAGTWDCKGTHHYCNYYIYDDSGKTIGAVDTLVPISALLTVALHDEKKAEQLLVQYTNLADTLEIIMQHNDTGSFADFYRYDYARNDIRPGNVVIEMNEAELRYYTADSIRFIFFHTDRGGRYAIDVCGTRKK